MKIEFKMPFPEKKHILRDLTEFVITHLLTQKEHQRIEICFESVRGLLDQDGLAGAMLKDSKNSYTLQIDAGAEITCMVSTVAHELVHVKQYVLGELKDTEAHDRFFWYEQEYSGDDMLYYWDFPWEIEAYGREVGLLLQFLDEYPEYKRQKWAKAILR